MEGFVVGVILGAALGAIVCAGVVRDSYAGQAVDRGYALYCPNNGEWAWLGECEGDE